MNKFAALIIFCIVFIPCVAKDGNFVLIIDAGHGGKDVGAPGVSNYEKNINLDVALKFGELVEKRMKDAEVVYTRKRDKFVPLQERANIANAAKGDLFVSIHTNSLDKRNRNRKTIKGTATYTLGLHRTDDNLEVAMRENSVISLEEDYTTTYKGFDPNSAESYIINEIYQNHYMEVLVELDFICNPTQEKYMASEKGCSQLAEALYNALVEYRKSNHDNVDSTRQYATSSQDEGKDKKTNVSRAGIEYKIQILAGRSKLPSNSKEFKGLKGVERYKDGNLYKYMYGATTDYDEVVKTLKKVQRKFKDAYIVTFKNGRLEK